MNISFVMPAYNSENTLEEAVDSIFDGNFEQGDEVIIVNDASSDKTLDTAKALVKKYTPNITVIDNAENKGCPASRNVGIARAKNELIFNIDSDNILATGNVRVLKETLIKEKADAAAFNEYFYFKTTKKEVTHRWICKTGVFTLADFFSGMVNQGPGGNYLYRKAVWERIGHYWEYGKGLHEAWGFSLKLLLNGAKFIVVPDTFYYHRYSHQSLFVRESKKANEEMNITKKFIEPALPRLDDASLSYVENNPDWYGKLESHPLYLRDGSRGTNGKIKFTSPIRQIAFVLKKMLR